MSGNLGFEIEGRRIKVEKLVAALDKELTENEVDPLALGVADGLAKWAPEAWARVAKKHEIRKPSDKTIAATIEAFRARESKGAAA